MRGEARDTRDIRLALFGELALFDLAHGQFGGLKAQAAVRAVAEGLVDRAAAPAQRYAGLACQIVLVALGVDEFDDVLAWLNQKWPVQPRGDLYRHDSS